MFSSDTEDALKTFRIAEFENIASYFPSKINCNSDPLSGNKKKKKENKSVLNLKEFHPTRAIPTKTYTSPLSSNESSFKLPENCSCTETEEQQ